MSDPLPNVTPTVTDRADVSLLMQEDHKDQTDIDSSVK